MIFTFPYHDPSGKYNKLLTASITTIQDVFSNVCASVTPSTIAKNSVMVDFLKQRGVQIFENSEASSVGDHYRNALQLATVLPGTNRIFFGFLDRVLFALNSNFESKFLESLNGVTADVCLFERSDVAWATHPDNYRKVEQLTNKFGVFFLGKEVEFGTCGFMISKSSAVKILPESVENTHAVGAEWILLLFLMAVEPIISKVDWLSWEDPFIEGIDPVVLKKQKECDSREITKRLEMNVPVVNLLIQKRFYPLLGSNQKKL